MERNESLQSWNGWCVQCINDGESSLSVVIKYILVAKLQQQVSCLDSVS